MKPGLDELKEGFIVSVAEQRKSVHDDFEQAKAAALQSKDAVHKPALQITNYTGGADNRYGIEEVDKSPVIWDYEYASGYWVLRR